MSRGPATRTPRRGGSVQGLRDTLDAGPRLAIAAVLVTCGTWAAVVFHVVMGQYLGRPYPWSTFLYAPSDHFADFYNVYDQARAFHPGESAVVVYSPLLHAFVTALTLIPAGVGLALIVATFLATLFAMLWFVAAREVRDPVSRLQQVVVLTLLAYPVLFAIDRGNLEMVVFVLLAGFFYLYCCRRSRWAWVPLALAISAKYYWAMLLVLPLLDRHYRQALFAAVGAVVAGLASAVLVVAVSGYTLGGFLSAMATSLGGYGERRGSVFYTHHAHGLWGVVILLNRAVDHVLSRQQHLSQWYLLLMAAVFVLVVVRLARGDYETWEKAAVLVLCALLMPYENADYTLVQWLLVFALFAAADPPGWRGAVITVLFAVTMVPFAYYYFPIPGRPDVGISTLVYPAALVTTGILVLTRPRTLPKNTREVGHAGSVVA